MKSLKESLLLERLVPCKKRAEDDPYMQDDWVLYIIKNQCTDEEWATAGQEFAEEMHNKGKIDDDEFNEMMDYYAYYEY